MRRTMLIAAVALFVIALSGCNTYETDKANKLVNEANVAITDANEKIQKGIDQLGQIEAAFPKIESEEELEKWRGVAKESIPLLEKARDQYKEAGVKFEVAGKLNLQDKFKEYLDSKGKEMKKRGEIADALLAEPRALLTSTTREDFIKEVQAVDAKVNSLKTEADDLAAKADKIYQENKQIFRASN